MCREEREQKKAEEQSAQPLRKDATGRMEHLDDWSFAKPQPRVHPDSISDWTELGPGFSHW